MQAISVGEITLANHLPFVLIGGMNVLESRDMALRIAEHFVQVTEKLNTPYIFKASFDKANRSSIHSFRGPGLDEGLRILQDIKDTFGMPVLTDIHEPYQAQPAAEVCDILQLPAFLARQTDLVAALAHTQVVINVKKPQFLAPQEMKHILQKFAEFDHQKVLLCERGSSFGYNNLVVDMLGIDAMKQLEAPIVFDVTHALQRPGGLAESAGGRREQVVALARSGLALGLAGLFVEAHPDPSRALCDGPCALPLDKLEVFLQQMQAIDQAVKSLPPIQTDD